MGKDEEPEVVYGNFSKKDGQKKKKSFYTDDAQTWAELQRRVADCGSIETYNERRAQDLSLPSPKAIQLAPGYKKKKFEVTGGRY